MSHTLILGQTESGKTTLAVKLAQRYRKARVPVLVLDPDQSSRWQADYITADPEAFLNVVRTSKSCAVFVDEAGYWWRRGHKEELEWLATNSRKRGHNCHFISQRAAQVPPNIRTQCVNIFLFKQGLADTRDLAAEFVSDDLMQAHTLVKGEYLGKVGVDGAVFKSRVF